MVPRYLSQGDCIGLVAPARKIDEGELAPAIAFLTQQGFRVKLGKNLFAQCHQFAGSDAQRAEDFQQFLDDDSVHAILCCRGGYGSVRIIDRLDFTHFCKSPKWICGYSDVTVFHSHLNNLRIPSLHCTMPINIQPNHFDNLSNQSFIKALTGQRVEYTLPANARNRNGVAEGEIVGGNLSILYSLMSSLSDINTENKILFIEDLDEYLYHIDRMMMCLKRAGKLKNLSGLIIGGMSDMNDNTIPFGQSGEEIIASHCSEYGFPVCFKFPAGHIADNVALKLGMRVRLSVNDEGSSLVFLDK